MGTVETLTAGGILRAPDVARIAAEERLEPAAAAVVLLKESGGGRNVWGHDGAPRAARSDAQGVIYEFGGPVTREAYLRYRVAAQAGRIPYQGVGPCQLTYWSLQQAADALAGCWDWTSNVRIGFRHLAGLVRAHGVQQGFRAYNGSGAAAERYGRAAAALLDEWRPRLAGP